MTKLNPNRSPVRRVRVLPAATAPLMRPLKRRSKSAPSAPPASLSLLQSDLEFASTFVGAAIAGHFGTHIAAELRANDARLRQPLLTIGVLTPRLLDDRQELAAWQDTTGGIKAIMAHLALVCLGAVSGFHLTLVDHAYAKALAGDEIRVELADFVGHQLHKALGRPVGFMFRLDIGTGRDPGVSLIGEINCVKAERKIAEGVLRQIGYWIETNQGLPTSVTSPSGLDCNLYGLVWDPVASLRKIFNGHRPVSLCNDEFVMHKDVSLLASAIFGEIRKTVRIGRSPARTH